MGLSKKGRFAETQLYYDKGTKQEEDENFLLSEQILYLVV